MPHIAMFFRPPARLVLLDKVDEGGHHDNMIGVGGRLEVTG